MTLCIYSVSSDTVFYLYSVSMLGTLQTEDWIYHGPSASTVGASGTNDLYWNLNNSFDFSSFSVYEWNATQKFGSWDQEWILKHRNQNYTVIRQDHVLDMYRSANIPVRDFSSMDEFWTHAGIALLQANSNLVKWSPDWEHFSTMWRFGSSPVKISPYMEQRRKNAKLGYAGCAFYNGFIRFADRTACAWLPFTVNGAPIYLSCGKNNRASFLCVNPIDRMAMPLLIPAQ